MSYQVFIERARDPAPEARVRLAHAIGARYNTPPAAIAQRLAAGRLRVKSGVDLATARQVAAQLEQLGAVCSVEDAVGRPVASLPGRAASPAAPAAASPLAGAASPLAGAGRPRTGADEPVGLAAALGPNVANQDLGALAADAPSLALATLDGHGDDDLPPAAIAFSQADGTTRTVIKKDDRLPTDDAFAPPEQAEPSLQLAIDRSELGRSALGRPAPGPSTLAPPAPGPSAPGHPGDAAHPASWHGAPHAAPGLALAPRDAPGPAPGPVINPAAGAAPGPRASPGAAAARAGGVRASSPGQVARALARGPRLRLAVGVAIALVAGFVPAHIVASVRERAAFAEIDGQVGAAQAAVSSVDDWRALDELRASKLADKESRRRSIAIASVLLWALVAGGVAFAWFRKIDWDRLARAGRDAPAGP